MSSDIKIKSLLKSTKVLIAEDDAVMLSLIRDVLGALGFSDVTVVKDGKTALTSIMTNTYDLVFCDWRMPELDGISFTRNVRHMADYEKCCVPIIMVTGKATLDDVKIARDAGVNEYLVKPFSIKLMISKVKSIIENPQQYILSDTYSGPDRRRKDDPTFIPTSGDRRKDYGRKAS